MIFRIIVSLECTLFISLYDVVFILKVVVSAVM